MVALLTDQRGNFVDQQTKRMRAISLMRVEEEPDCEFSDFHLPPPTVPIALAQPERYEKIKSYLATNLFSGFAPPDALRMTQAYAEALLQSGPLGFISPTALEDIAAAIQRAAQELSITSPEKRYTTDALL